MPSPTYANPPMRYSRPTTSKAKLCRADWCTAMMQPPSTENASRCHTCSRSLNISVPMPISSSAMHILSARISRRRSTMSAIVPAMMPRKNSGAMRIAIATPTMNGSSVSSSTSQPMATCSPIKPMASKNDADISTRKSRKRNTGEERRLSLKCRTGLEEGLDRLGVCTVALLCTQTRRRTMRREHADASASCDMLCRE